MTMVDGDDFYDFFDDSTEAGHDGRRSSVTVDPAARWIGRMASLTGWLGVLVVVVVGVRLLAPAFSFPGAMWSVSVWIAIAASCGAASVILLAVAVMKGRRAGRRGIASGAAVALVLAGMLAGGVAIAHRAFPDGMVRPPVRDEAPASDAQAMRQGLEQVSGSCGQWQEHSASGYPGVASVAVCVDAKVAYVTFDNRAAAGMYKAPVRAKIQEMLSDHADDERTQGQWGMVSGGTWMVVGKLADMERLQDAWGGTVERVE